MKLDLAALAAVTLVLACGRATPPPDVSGHWEGSISVEGMELDILVDLAGTTDSITGTIDIPLQGAEGLRLTSIILAGDSLSFDLVAGPGVASFHGLVVADSSISGAFEQAAVAGTFELLRSEPAPEVVRPYVMTDVTIPGDGFVLAGTLSMPSDSAAGLPGVVLLTGSGPQDRDENVFGFKVFDILADYLTRQGFAVLRCDDRGVGGSTGANPALTDSILALDAGLMLDFLRSQRQVDPLHVGLLGHSEGSNVAFLAAAERPAGIAFVVSMAGPSVSGYDVLLGQIEAMARASGKTDDQVAALLSLQKCIMDSVIAGGSLDSLRLLIEQQMLAEIEAMPEAQRQALGDIDAYVSQGMARSMQVVESPWFRRFLIVNPSDYAGQVSCPVLALYGSLDVQVPPSMNEGPMRQALAANPAGRVVVFEGANHLFQAAVAGTVEEYPTLAREFIPGFLDSVGVWMRSAASASAATD
jgi:pimeloyl-ACP methyl ester carboxylesterase